MNVPPGSFPVFDSPHNSTLFSNAPRVSVRHACVEADAERLLVDTDLIEFVCLENEKFRSQFRN